MNVHKTLQARGLETNPGWAAFSITFYIFVSINVTSCTTSPPILKNRKEMRIRYEVFGLQPCLA